MVAFTQPPSRNLRPPEDDPHAGTASDEPGRRRAPPCSAASPKFRQIDLVANHADVLDVDVLKAAHHGADNGTSDDWLAAVTPERVVISAGVNANHRHPRPDAVAAYIASTGGRVYCTNRHKTIRVYGKADGSIRIIRQNAIDKSCVFDGTHY